MRVAHGREIAQRSSVKTPASDVQNAGSPAGSQTLSGPQMSIVGWSARQYRCQHLPSLGLHCWDKVQSSSVSQSVCCGSSQPVM